MYGVEGRSWVSMGDPVAPIESMSELVWRFREACDEYDGWPVFYQVDKENLSIYVEQGLTILKIGEEARVRLADFSLEGQHKSLRSNRNKLARAGLSFEIIDRANTKAILPQLRVISDSWLMEKKAKEKGFSLGFFSEDYLNRFPCAVIRYQQEIIAFANVLQTVSKSELSIDLMRYQSHGLNGVMDYLFTELLLWGRPRDTSGSILGWPRCPESTIVPFRRSGTRRSPSLTSTETSSIASKDCANTRRNLIRFGSLSTWPHPEVMYCLEFLRI